MEISSTEIIAVLVQLLALSLVLERAFHFIFHFSLFRSFFSKQDIWIKSLKALMVLIVSLWVCAAYDIDAVARIIKLEDMSKLLGYVITALVLAGGSAGIRQMMIFIRTLSEAKIRASK